MANYGYIRSKLNGNVIDIQQASKKLERDLTHTRRKLLMIINSGCWFLILPALAFTLLRAN